MTIPVRQPDETEKEFLARLKPGDRKVLQRYRLEQCSKRKAAKARRRVA
jgi:hypothetical protein